jgi:hypothetical protein
VSDERIGCDGLSCLFEGAVHQSDQSRSVVEIEFLLDPLAAQESEVLCFYSSGCALSVSISLLYLDQEVERGGNRSNDFLVVDNIVE